MRITNLIFCFLESTSGAKIPTIGKEEGSSFLERKAPSRQKRFSITREMMVGIDESHRWISPGFGWKTKMMQGGWGSYACNEMQKRCVRSEHFEECCGENCDEEEIEEC